MVYADDEFEEVVGSNIIKNNLLDMKNLNWHSIRTVLMLVVIFAVAGLTAIHDYVPFAGTIDMIMPVLLYLEHKWAGKSQ